MVKETVTNSLISWNNDGYSKFHRLLCLFFFFFFLGKLARKERVFTNSATIFLTELIRGGIVDTVEYAFFGPGPYMKR